MAQGWVTGRKLRRRLVGVFGSLLALVMVAGCGYWRPFSDAVVGIEQGSVVVLEFGGAGTGGTGRTLVTSDDGLHWQVSHAFPTPTDPSRLPGLSLHTEDCVPGAPEHCYRVVSGHALVQETRDAGRHWFTAWQLSAGRELFLRRSGGYAEDTTGAGLRLGSTSLVVLPAAAGHVVIVADQNDGLVVRTADGRWTRTGLAQQPPDSTAPVPVTGLGRGLGKEYLLALCAAGLALLAGVAAARLRRDSGRSRRVAAAQEAARIVLGLLWMAGLDLTDGLEGEPGTGQATVMVLLTLCVLTGLLTVRRKWPAGRRLSGALTGAALGVGLLSILAFLGWTLALPDSYSLACTLALLLFLCGLSGTWLLGHRLSAPDSLPGPSLPIE